MRTLLTCCGLAGLAFTAPAAAQTKPADAEQIVDALNACQAITSPTWLELKDLPSHGWEGAQRRSGRSSTTVRGVYEKDGNNSYIIIGKDELREKVCVVSARLATTSDYVPTAQAVSRIIGMPGRADGFTYYWTIGDKQIRLDPAGERTAPTARFAVTAIAQERAE